MIEKQIELEKKMTQLSVETYHREYQKAIENNSFSNTAVATHLISHIVGAYASDIKQYIIDYSKGRPVRSTIAAQVIKRLDDVDAVAYISAKTILNSLFAKVNIQALYKAIGQALEDEYKMREYKGENLHYYTTIQEDLNKRGAKANRKKNILTGVFNKRLNFHLDRWTVTEKFQVGMVLTALFVKSTELVEYEHTYKKHKHLKTIVPSQALVQWIEQKNTKLELLQPFFLPMVCKPKEWTGIFEGGYISPYLRRNKLIKNNNKEYLTMVATSKMPLVYQAVNTLQNTEWKINIRVLSVAASLWDKGLSIAGLPDREDEPLIPFPFPDSTPDVHYTPEELEIVKKWKRDTYEIHKRNVQKRSIRLLTAQIINLAQQFHIYPKIWFPYQMDFRGRLYPIPALLQPQGTDLAKGLLHFANGKKLNPSSIKWLEIHGANTYGYDKVSYEKRIEWIHEHRSEIQAYAQAPLDNLGWAEADKPFQFLAFCFEYNDYLLNPDSTISYLPIQLDGTCNGLQHYSALLKDEEGGKAVNLIPSDKPHDIYSVVAKNLEEKLKTNNTSLAQKWLSLGINRKLTKRPVMVLPYGGTRLSCRDYIQEYLTDSYSSNYLWTFFKEGQNKQDCLFKVSLWLSKFLWESIRETLRAAVEGMDYIRRAAKEALRTKPYLEWMSPAGLFIRQEYKARRRKEINTELYGKIYKVNVNIDTEETDYHRQLNGICPNFIHSLDAACLMLYLNKCKEAGIESFLAVHDCYGVLAADTDISAKLLREAFVEIYEHPILDIFTQDILPDNSNLPVKPKEGELNIKNVLASNYFFN